LRKYRGINPAAGGLMCVALKYCMYKYILNKKKQFKSYEACSTGKKTSDQSVASAEYVTVI
jgi:hypothetical protein